MLLGMSHILQVPTFPTNPCLLPSLASHVYDTCLATEGIGFWDMPISWPTPLLSTTQMLLFYRIICLVRYAHHFSTTSVYLLDYSYSAMALGVCHLQCILKSHSLSPLAFVKQIILVPTSGPWHMLFSLPLASSDFMSSSKSQLKCHLFEEFFSSITPTHLR